MQNTVLKLCFTFNHGLSWLAVNHFWLHVKICWLCRPTDNAIPYYRYRSYSIASVLLCSGL